jgi:hypothetical protein
VPCSQISAGSNRAASKGALRSAVDDHVTAVAHAALAVRRVEGDIVEDLAERLTALVADHFVGLR